MVHERPLSTYGHLSCGIASTIPKRITRRESWIRLNGGQEEDSRPISFSESTMNKEIVSEAELPSDKGYVKRRTIFFENKATSPSGELESKPKPQETVAKVVKYRIRKPSLGYSAPVHRKSEVIQKIISLYENNENIIENLKRKDGNFHLRKKPSSRRHTIECFSSSSSQDHNIDNELEIYSKSASDNELKRKQKRYEESTNKNLRTREIPDQFLPANPGVSSRPDAKVVGCVLRDAKSELNSSEKLLVKKSVCDVNAMNDLWQEAYTVPRVVAASIKSYKDIPEELFNSLPESSVDPNPNGEKEPRNSEWRNMLKMRHALLRSGIADADNDTEIDDELESMPDKTDKYSDDEPAQFLPHYKPQNKGNHKSLGNKDHYRNSEEGKLPVAPTTPSSASSNVGMNDYLRQLESDLRAAGIYFRLPPPPTIPPPALYAEEVSNDGDVNVALATLDASLEGFSSNSSSESVSLAHSRSSSVSAMESQLSEGSREVNVGGDESREKISITPVSYMDRKRLFGDSLCVTHSPGNKTIIQLRGNMSKEGKGGGELESLNLIEEVYVSTRTKSVPDSTIQMKAYYPGVDFNKTANTPIVQIVIDNDSGHESGATSPCGTLTGDDNVSPPPSPSSPKQKQSINVEIESHPPPTKEHCENPKSPGTDNREGLGTAVVGQMTTDSITEVDIETPSIHSVVVAIDFGTTYSGYAFSFTRDPENVYMMKKWEGGDPGIQNQKTPTIVLLTPDEEFHSLGFAARDTFHDLDPKVAQKWFYFDKFKMELHSNQVLTRDTLLTAKNGKKVLALKIFYFALRYFRDHAIKELSDQTRIDVEEEDIRWVITVPAIWSHPAKQFMRTAAYQAGMASPSKQDKLLIALEPEAAAIYCRRLRQNQLLQERTPETKIKRLPGTSSLTPTGTLKSTKGFQGEEDNCFPELDREEFISLNFLNCDKVGDWLRKGTVYMVVDCGGGTVDITVHQMTDRRSGHLKELHKATGGPYGSIGVDKEFEELLNLVFGAEFMNLFKLQRSAAFVDLMIAFESRKRNASPYKTTPLNIALPFSFIDLFKRTCKKEVESAIKNYSYLGIKWSSQGMLRIEQDTMQRLFIPTLEKITKSIRSVLSTPEVEGIIQYMFLVGGFAESELLQKHIRDSFGEEINVIIPQGMGLAILRGAVQFGLDPSVVTVRRSRLTYGVGILNSFEDGVHPSEKRVFAAGSVWCADILDKFVEVDQSIAVGDVVTRSYTPATPTQKSVILHLYATPQHDVKFVTESSVQRVGTLQLDLNKYTPDNTKSDKTNVQADQANNPRREITVHLNFGGTEIKASAVDHQTGQCVKTNIEFLAL